jgi:uncharacterized HAD superfamily protein
MERIGVDFDEVIVECLSSFLQHYNTKHQTSFSYEEFLSYRWWEILGIPREGAYTAYKEYIMQKVVSREGEGVMPLVTGVAETLPVLVKRYEFHLVTSRPLLLENHTIAVLKELGDGQLLIPHERLHYTARVVETSGANYRRSIATKAEVCMRYGISRMIEDDIEVAKSCAQQGIEILLFDKPWNRDFSGHPLIHRKRDWQQIHEHLMRC